MHINPAPAPEQPAAMHTMMVLGVALGWRTPLLKSGLLGLSCLYAAAGILLHKLDDHAVRGIKKMIPMMPKSFPPIIAATRVYSGESPTDFPTTRG